MHYDEFSWYLDSHVYFVDVYSMGIQNFIGCSFFILMVWFGFHAFCTDFESMLYYAYHKQAPIKVENCKHATIDLVSHDIERKRRTLESHLVRQFALQQQ